MNRDEILQDGIVASDFAQRLERRQARFNALAHSILNGRVDMAVLEDKFDKADLATQYLQIVRCWKCERLKVQDRACSFCGGEQV